MTERLRLKDLERINAFLTELYALADLDGVRDQLLRAIPRLVPADRVSVFESNAGLKQMSGRSAPHGVFDGDLPKIYAAYIRQSPLLNAYERGEGSAVRYSDFLSTSKLHRLGLYNEYLRTLEVEYRMAKGLPGREGWVTSLLLDRKLRDFSERDRLVLNVLRPHLNQSYRNARAFAGLHEWLGALEDAVGALDRGLVILTADGTIRWASPRARRWLTDYFGPGRAPHDALPEPVARWLTWHARSPGEVVAPHAPLVVPRGDIQLSIRFVSGPAQTVLLLEQHYLSIPPEALRGLGLTRRETEVLAWVAEGKTSGEIASILGMAGRTVEKHLERIYPKLGVETRTAAAARALAWVASARGGHRPDAAR